MDLKEAKSVVESLLFIWGEPLKVKEIAKVLEISQDTVIEIVKELKKDMHENGRGIQIIEVNDSIQLCSVPKNHPYIEKMCMTSQSRGLSQPTLEVLAIIAYKQPITKYEIDSIRGVKSDKAINNLLERELIEIKGRLEKTGRPIIYGTTDVFLKCFGFKSLEELPSIDDFENLDFLNQDKDYTDK